MRTTIVYLVLAVGFTAIAAGLYGGLRNTNRLWFLAILGGLVLAFCSVFWLWPAIDDAWARVEIEQLRLELRTTKLSLTASDARIAEQSKTISQLTRDRDATQLLEQQYVFKLRSAIFSFQSVKEHLQSAGLIFPSNTTNTTSNSSSSTTELIDYLDQLFNSLNDGEIDRAPLRSIFIRLSKSLHEFSTQFPDQKPLLFDGADQVSDQVDDPKVAFDKLIDRLNSVKNTNSRASSTLFELRASLNFLKSNQLNLEVPTPPGLLDGYLQTDSERNETIIKLIRSLQKIRISNIFVANVLKQLSDIESQITREHMVSTPELVNTSGLSDDAGAAPELTVISKLEGLKERAVAAKAEIGIRQACGSNSPPSIIATAKVSSNQAEPLSSCAAHLANLKTALIEHSAYIFSPLNTNGLDTNDRVFKLTLNGTGPSKSLQFRPGAYFIDDPIESIVKPLTKLKLDYLESGMIESIKRFYVAGSADEAIANQRLYRTELLPEELRRMKIARLTPGSSTISEETDFLVASDYVRNHDLPNLRAAWTAHILSTFFPSVDVRIVDGQQAFGLEPAARTVALTIVIAAKANESSERR